MRKVLIATDDCLTATGLDQLLSGTGDLQLTGSCFDMDVVGDTVAHCQPDVVLLDTANHSCLSVIEQIKRVNSECRICLWTGHIPSELAYEAMAKGVQGILRRPVDADAVVTCLRTLGRNEVWFEEHFMAGFLARRAVRLTKRESELVNLLTHGMSNKEIAYRLSLSEGTVKVYLSRLFVKLKVKDRLELALYGLRNFNTEHRPAAPPIPGHISSSPPSHTLITDGSVLLPR